MSKNILIHKSIMEFNKIKKLFKSRDANGASILINSFPKSGTHLLSQLFERNPYLNDYGLFINHATSYTFKELPNYKVESRISTIIPGELCKAHLRYNESYVKLLDLNNTLMLFIYRDPRDIVISEAHYLTYMNKWHRLHKYFKKFNNDFSKSIDLAIDGISNESSLSNMYPNINDRFSPFLGWVDEPSSATLSVKFEELIDKNDKHKILNNISDHCKHHINHSDIPHNYFSVDNFEYNINPSRSHTFRKGKSNYWETQLSTKQKRRIDLIAGELIHKLGYRETV